MGYKYKNYQEDVPGYGAIFMSNTGTKKECFQRKLLGLPLAQSNFVLNVKKGMILFLFEFERRQLHGVFRATSNGEINIEPHAFKSSGKQFPAQVRFTTVWNCKPLSEHEFQDAIIDNYFSVNKFKFGLSKDQVYNLVKLFHSKRIPKTNPERSLRQKYDDDKEVERDSRFGDDRKKMRDRLRFSKQEDDDIKDYRNFLDIRALNDKRELVSPNYLSQSQSDNFRDHGTRQLQLEKHLNHDNRTHDEYHHSINSFTQTLPSHTPDRRSQMIDTGGGYFGHETLEREQRTLTQHSEGASDVWININPTYEPRLSTEHPPYEPRGTDISLFNQNSDFIPIAEYQHPFEFDNIGGNTYESGFPYSISSDPSMITMDIHTPYNPEVPEFCHKSSYFTPVTCSSPISNRPSETSPYPSENKHPDAGKFRSSYARKVSVFDRLTSVPKKAVKHEQEVDEKDELDASVDKVMKMLEKIVSSPIKRTSKRQSGFKRQYTFKQDDENSEIVDHEFPNIEGESVIEETRVVEFKRRKKGSKNLEDESKEVGTESDVGKRRKLVRPLFVRKESTVESNESAPVKGDCCLTKAVESLEKIEGEKSSTEGEVCSQVEGNGNGENCEVLKEQTQEKHGSDDVDQVETSKNDSKMCGWIEG